MIYVIYIVLAAIVVWFSVKSAEYVDLIDKKTDISGAFIGGVILAAVTSLPELFTSISATIILKKPELVLGNILGSNIFNLAILAFLILFGIKNFSTASISKSNLTTTLFGLAVYIVLTFTVLMGYSFDVYTIGITSVIIAVLYIVSVKFMASDDSSTVADDESSKLTVKQIVFRFILTAIGLVLASIAITYATDALAKELNLGATLAGALFLGIATSLPEVTSCISLVKRKNFNAATGNVVGSNMFNFFILFLGDLMYSGGNIYTSGTDAVAIRQSNNLIIYGLISAVSIAVVLFMKNRKVQNKAAYVIPSIVSAACYFAFLIFSM